MLKSLYTQDQESSLKGLIHFDLSYMNSVLESINQASLNLLKALTPEETYPVVVQEAVKLVNALYGSIILEEKGQMTRSYSTSPYEFTIKNRTQGNLYKSFKENEVIVVEANTDSDYHKLLRSNGIKTSYFIPLSYRSNSMGILIIDSPKSRSASDEVLNVLKLYGSMATLAIRKAQLHEETNRAIQLRDLFISLAAHEIRTPLTTISVYLDLLKKRLEKEGNISYQKWTDVMSQETSRLAHLVNELLEINNIKTGKFQYVFKHVKLSQIIDQSLVNFKGSHPNRKVIYKPLVRKNDELVGDSEKLVQVIVNVLNNAHKFSPHDREIILEASYKKPYYTIIVKDYGEGIRTEDLPRIFEGFYKGRDNQKPGMGLGLYLAKSIIEQHGGKISVESQLGEGTTVQIKLRDI